MGNYYYFNILASVDAKAGCPWKYEYNSNQELVALHLPTWRQPASWIITCIDHMNHLPASPFSPYNPHTKSIS